MLPKKYNDQAENNAPCASGPLLIPKRTLTKSVLESKVSVAHTWLPIIACTQSCQLLAATCTSPASVGCCYALQDALGYPTGGGGATGKGKQTHRRIGGPHWRRRRHWQGETHAKCQTPPAAPAAPALKRDTFNERVCNFFGSVWGER